MKYERMRETDEQIQAKKKLAKARMKEKEAEQRAIHAQQDVERLNK